jgi:TPR repeat protein
MIKSVTTALVINLLVHPCFAMDNDQKDFSPTHTPSSLQESNFREKLLSKNVIWPEFQTTLNSPTTFKELFETHQLFQIASHSSRKKFALANAWHGDQLALEEVIAQRWYKSSNLFELTDLIVRMAQLNSPVAQGLLKNYQTLFKPHEILRVLDIIVDQIKKENPVASRVLGALICHTPLEKYAFPEHFPIILKFITDQSQNKANPNFAFQIKLLEVYANGHYGIKKVYNRNKRFAREQMFHFALKDENPKAQMFLLKAYHEGLFGINNRSRVRLNEARGYLEQFSTTNDMDFRNLIEQAYSEGWYNVVSHKTRPNAESSPQTSTTTNFFDHRLIKEISEYLGQAIVKKKNPMDVLEIQMHKIEQKGFNGINYGAKKNRKLALNALKDLAEEGQSFPAQTFLIHVYHDGLFGIKKANRTRQREALEYLNTFAFDGNHHVQMLHLYTMTEGWFNVDPTEKTIQRKALNLARHYAFQGNPMAQIFLIDIYEQGILGTKLDPKRHSITLKLKEEFNYYPSLYESKHTNSNIFLVLSE